MNEEAVPDVAASFVSKLCSAVIPAGDADVNNTTTAGQVAIMSRASACEGSRVRVVCVEVSGPRLRA
jgi:hypothetical protein